MGGGRRGIGLFYMGDVALMLATPRKGQGFVKKLPLTLGRRTPNTKIRSEKEGNGDYPL